MISPRQFIIGIVVFILGLGITLFILHQTRALARGPEITITEPQNGATIPRSFVRLKGTSDRISELSINNFEVLPNTDGNFEYPTLLSPGTNIIVIHGIDRFGKETKLRMQLYADFEEHDLTLPEPEVIPDSEEETINEEVLDESTDESPGNIENTENQEEAEA